MSVDISEDTILSQTMAAGEFMTKAKEFLTLYKWYVVAVLVAIFVLWAMMSSSSFTDPNNIHRYVVGQDEMSMDDKINAAVRSRSQLTGTRDVPVFFQDYGIEATVDEASGNVVTQHGETFAGDKDEIYEIEKKFMLTK